MNNINKKISDFLPLMNNYSSRKEWEDACWKRVLKSEELMDLFITPYERHNAVMRIAVIDRIFAGKSYREISEELYVSSQTISVIKKSIDEKSYRSYLERSKTERKKKKYSISPIPDKPKYRGRPKRTKYGTIYMPF